MSYSLDLRPHASNYYVVAEIVISRISEKHRESVLDILQENQPVSQKKHALQRKGLSKALIDELEIVCDNCTCFLLVFRTRCLTSIIDEDYNVPLLRLEKHSAALAATIKPYLLDIHNAIILASPLTNSVIRVQPLMIGKRHDFFKNGVCFEVVNPRKRTDILAVGGR